MNLQLVLSFHVHIRRSCRGAWLQQSGDLQARIIVEEKQRTLECYVPDDIVLHGLCETAANEFGRIVLIAGDGDFSDSAFQDRDGDHAESDLLLRHVGSREGVTFLLVELRHAHSDLLEVWQSERAPDVGLSERLQLGLRYYGVS